MTDDDRREHTRVRTALRLDLAFETVGEFTRHESFDFSAGGAFIRSARPPARGAICVLQLQLADRGFLLTGRVVRVVEDGPESGFGVEFNRPSRAAAVELVGMIAASQRNGDQTKAPKAATFNGRLEKLGLSPLIAMLEMERMTGRVEVTNAIDERRGTLYVREGRIVDAEIDGDRVLESAECVYEMIAWGHGQFAFNVGEVSRKQLIEPSSTGLLMEAARRTDERDR